MGTLYPPKIESKLPAFVDNILKVPFQLNKAHSIDEIDGMMVIVKTVTTGAIKYKNSVTDDDIHYNEETKNYFVEFNLTPSNGSESDLTSFAPTPGQYYKIQLAFMQGTDIGYYSSTGIIKCISTPTEFGIEGLDATNSNNLHKYEYVGVYSQQNRDITERVYTYRFDLKTSSGELVATSGDCIHNSSKDEFTYKSYDKWTVSKTLDRNTVYTISYSVTTLNGYTFKTNDYSIIAGETIDLDVPMQLIVNMDNDDGCAQVYLCRDKNETSRAISGKFILIRSSSEDDFGSWNEICSFELAQQYVDDGLLIWEDFTLTHGVKYIYAIQAYNDNNLYTNRLLNVEEKQIIGRDGRIAYTYTQVQLLADYEDAFLFDGTRQLKIRFNPKVSSFKATVLESKVDTIGGKYPFIFRNGIVKYKEFPISGLISLISDPNERFFSNLQNSYKNKKRAYSIPEDGLESDINVTSRNVERERRFKMEVLEWLTNGQTKLFRSPGEGNYIVRLMNTSLTPNDTLGRMLHTFSCTAYEIAEYNFENLREYGFIEKTAIEPRTMRMAQIQLSAPAANSRVVNNIIHIPDAYMVSITDATPGTVMKLKFRDDGLNAVSIEIGTTGAYYVEVKDSPVKSIELESGSWYDAKLTYGYYDTYAPSSFTFISKIDLSDEICQLFGQGLEFNLIDILEDVRKNTGKFYYIRVKVRDHVSLYSFNGKYYRNELKTDELPVANWHKDTIYYIINEDKWYIGSPSNQIRTQKELDEMYIFTVNSDVRIDFAKNGSNAPITSGRYEALSQIDSVKTMTGGKGLVFDLVYQLKTITYSLEETNLEVAQAKADWKTTVNTYKELENNDSAVQDAITAMNNAYNIYISKLSRAIQEEKEAYSVVHAL